jgi:gamma-glutamylcyclotransferase (GGCT)/AIG2-like uncharacterized protein YtfP
MTMCIFTYGSLMFPRVWLRVVRGSYRSEPAVAHGFARFAIAGETYPGMVPRDGESVAGVLYYDVSAPDIAALDAFEGEEYRRVAISVRTALGADLEVGTYLYLRPEKLTESPWIPAAFQMERFIGSYCRDKLGE